MAISTSIARVPAAIAALLVVVVVYVYGPVGRQIVADNAATLGSAIAQAILPELLDRYWTAHDGVGTAEVETDVFLRYARNCNIRTIYFSDCAGDAAAGRVLEKVSAAAHKVLLVEGVELPFAKIILLNDSGDWHISSPCVAGIIKFGQHRNVPADD